MKKCVFFDQSWSYGFRYLMTRFAGVLAILVGTGFILRSANMETLGWPMVMGFFGVLVFIAGLFITFRATVKR